MFGGCFVEETLDHVLGEVVAEIKRSPPTEAAIDSIVRDVQQEGALGPKEGGTPLTSDEGIPAASVVGPLSESQFETKEGPACGDEK
ncbi:UNVERIFIED_CONTAM: hypothetical protein Slati_2216000 [Sesamum latifolium]|uniref:Uncharacterized protein n=1 Tax=Sesamum latifolium TaxID=2727402 RepID=A0AAW2WU72_9LAMI